MRSSSSGARDCARVENSSCSDKAFREVSEHVNVETMLARKQPLIVPSMEVGASSWAYHSHKNINNAAQSNNEQNKQNTLESIGSIQS